MARQQWSGLGGPDGPCAWPKANRASEWASRAGRRTGPLSGGCFALAGDPSGELSERCVRGSVRSLSNSHSLWGPLRRPSKPVGEAPVQPKPRVRGPNGGPPSQGQCKGGHLHRTPLENLDWEGRGSVVGSGAPPPPRSLPGVPVIGNPGPALPKGGADGHGGYPLREFAAGPRVRFQIPGGPSSSRSPMPHL